MKDELPEFATADNPSGFGRVVLGWVRRSCSHIHPDPADNHPSPANSHPNPADSYPHPTDSHANPTDSHAHTSPINGDCNRNEC